MEGLLLCQLLLHVLNVNLALAHPGKNAFVLFSFSLALFLEALLLFNPVLLTKLLEFLLLFYFLFQELHLIVDITTCLNHGKSGYSLFLLGTAVVGCGLFLAIIEVETKG